MAVYKRYFREASLIKKDFMLHKNDDYPEEVIVKRFKASSAQAEEVEDAFHEKVQRIRPNMTFFGGYCDTSSGDSQYSRSMQYRSNFQSSSSSVQSQQFKSDEAAGIPEYAYYTNLRMKNILVADKYFRQPKMDFFIVPMIYQFVLLEISKTDEEDQIDIQEQHRFRVQNLILQLLLSDKQTQRKSRQRKDLFKKVFNSSSENSNINNNNKEKSVSVQSKQKQQQQENSSNEGGEEETEDKQAMHSKYYNQKTKDNILADFSRFCDGRYNFDLEQFISSIAETQRREKNLLFNAIMLAIAFFRILINPNHESKLSAVRIAPTKSASDSSCGVSLKKSSSSKASVTSKRKSNSSRISSSLSNFIDLVETMDYFDVDIPELLSYYVKHFEGFVDNYDLQLDDYFKLNGQASKRGIIGALSSQKEIDSAVGEYRAYVNDPKTQGLRSYQYHDENRKKWTEEQYRRFLVLYRKHMRNHVNNRPIALEMGQGIHANHVRYEKQVYMIGMRRRSEANNITLEEQVERDIANFSLDYFKKKGCGSQNDPDEAKGDDQEDDEDDYSNRERDSEDDDEEEDDEDKNSSNTDESGELLEIEDDQQGQVLPEEESSNQENEMEQEQRE